MKQPISTGSTIGILGSGQLGRMLAQAAKNMGYRVHIFSPELASPAGQVADLETVADYTDLEAVRRFARQVDVVTYEFENVPAATAETAAQHTPLHPGGWVLHTTQNRLREKRFIEQNDLPVTPFVAINSLPDLKAAIDWLGCPTLLKSAESGYDGKGQYLLTRPDEVETAWQAVGGKSAVLELFLELDKELSVVGVRDTNGRFEDFGVMQNKHRHHILDISSAPAHVPPEIAAEAISFARRVLEALDVVGVMCVEMFLTKDGRLLINELAPRVHNSGHLTIEACTTSQFEQHIRAICGLPLEQPTYHSPAAMANLLGDLWQTGEPNWSQLQAIPGVHLHLYGKQQPRPGRKMGHLTALAHTPEAAIGKVELARQKLKENV